MATPREVWQKAFSESSVRPGAYETMSGIPLEPVYGPDDGEFPGVYPYTRGPYASMYRSKLWTMRMFAGFGTADDTNKRFKDIINSGGDGLSTAFDMPTLLGLDSDDTMSLGEVGRCGVAIDTVEDMDDLYRDIDLGKITTSMTINSPAAVLFSMFIAQAERNGTPRARLGGTLQNDILKEYQAQKEFVFLHARECASCETPLRSPQQKCRNGIQCPFLGITFVKLALLQRKNWLLLLQMVLPMWNLLHKPDYLWMHSHHGCHSSSTHTLTSSKRLQSIALLVVFGHAG